MDSASFVTLPRPRFLVLSLFALIVLVPLSARAQAVEWTERAVGGPPSWLGHAMAYDSARGVTVLFGGTTDSGYIGETWEWDGTAWTQRSVGGPAPRPSSAMAYDEARAVTVLFGGLTVSSNGNDETWEWNGTVWTPRAVSGPSARRTHAMAYDPARGVTVLFGGVWEALYPNGETWEWNGTSWTQRPVSGPSRRHGPAMAHDTARGVTVLFGGYTECCGASGRNGETWEWNGTTWTRRVVGGPSPRYLHAMAYDTARGVTVLYGGYRGSASGETWEWNGAAWNQRPITGPSPRYEHAMAYDSARGVTVLFGGSTGSGETWELGCVGLSMQPASQIVCPEGSVSIGVNVTGNGPFIYQWQWQRSGDSAWLPIVEGLNSLVDVPQFEAAGSATEGISLLPALATGVTRIWPNSGYRVRAVVTNGCGPTTSGPATLTICPADFNCTGELSVQDIFDFLSAYFAADPAADFNGSGPPPTVQDIFDFLAAYFAGC